MPYLPASATAAPRKGQARDILRLAVPAFGALVAEPLFLLADSAIIGHLGVAQLAGVGLASAVLHTAVGLMVFLAYSTTPAVARAIGDGQLGKALAAGRDGVWLALLLGVVLAVAGFLAADPLVGLLGADGEVRAFAVDYLRWSMPGLVAMLLIFAGTGLLRGLQDTRTPLVVATAGFALNIVLNLWLVYGLGWSVTGSAVGTSVAQWAMAGVYLLIVRRNAVRSGVGLLPSWRGIRSMARVGSWLMLRTLSLRIAILATVVVVTSQGAVNLAAHQLAMTIFSFLAFALDALAIAAQALIGKELGASNAGKARLLTGTMVRWGLGFGAVTGLLLAVAAPWAGALFTSDPQVRSALALALWVLAAGQPLAGYVFVLDGVLIGAGDARYLALAGVMNLAAYVPMLAAVALLGAGGGAGLAWLWAAFALGYMAARAVTLGLRARSDRWMVLGSA
ncbi:MATE family efflux transporter [Pseudarthrobacter oxydans]|uniref:MATE family efflux protein n=1 Tax=Pseudarthrobacter oxydans TaxID=1671 RepID=A0AAW8NCL4_PSEOX|nr:MATE family efflux transporter [Pseudarthrobacter oxydans]MDV2980425.1 MATE family efflux transporter [Actinomycetes bacterium ARC8]WHP59342.1 MATE family efflux transporter [Arthrobacter sp. KFRI-F3372]MDR6793593.1 putative MATE family efflux protein [Pseudarthrobacter oxydans]MDR7164591.1 putative MATE family efflux protein [Pseudarthrobacter oxydans]NSX36686.1 MATE family efflux transporter [Pseudarthrobacter oxydans]